jgi:hypothetical protein
MILRCNLTEADYRAFNRHIDWRSKKAPWIYAGTILLLSVLLWFGGRSGESGSDKIERLVGVWALTAAFVLIVSPLICLYLWIRRRLRRRQLRNWIGERVVDISADGVIVSSKHGKVETPLSAISRFDETHRHFFIITTGGLGHIIPKRDLPDMQPLRELQSQVMENRANVGSPRPASR